MSSPIRSERFGLYPLKFALSLANGAPPVQPVRLLDMCRNIRPLFNFDPPTTPEEIEAASLQFVRKISGFTKPSKANEAVFRAAVFEISAVSSRLLEALETV